MLFGSSYWVTQRFLPADTPLRGADLRALPAGVVLLLIARHLPTGAWWWRAACDQNGRVVMAFAYVSLEFIRKLS